MTIKTPGSNNILSLGTTANSSSSNSSISAEHGGAGDLKLSDYYQISAGGLTHSINTSVPSSGQIKMSNFLGTEGGVATKSASGGTTSSNWTSVTNTNSSGGTAASGSRVNVTVEYSNNRIKYVFEDYTRLGTGVVSTNGTSTTQYQSLSGGLTQATALTKDAKYITAIRYRWVLNNMKLLHFSNNGAGVKVTYALGLDSATGCYSGNDDFSTSISAGNYSTLNVPSSYRTINYAGGISANKSFSTAIECRANESRPANNNSFSVASSTLLPENQSDASGGYLRFEMQVFSEGSWQTATLWTTNQANVSDGGTFNIQATSSKSPTNNT
jgi:hypothetical protein